MSSTLLLQTALLLTLLEQSIHLRFRRHRVLLDSSVVATDVLLEESLERAKVRHGRLVHTPLVQLRKAMMNVGGKNYAATDRPQCVSTAMWGWQALGGLEVMDGF
jgi:hypothetical protein